MMRHVIIVLTALLCLTALTCLAVFGFNDDLTVVRYTVDAGGLPTPVRLALITDLHGCAYGRDERQLLDAIAAEAPDLVLLGGDIFTDTLPDGNTEALLAGITGRYACWYVTGNHEYKTGRKSFAPKEEVFLRYGIPHLGDAMEVTVGASHFTLCGVDDPKAWKKKEREQGYASRLRALGAQTADGFSVLLAHRPEYASLYAECGFDLVLCGHTHGGQWRIPGILNGLFAPNQGWFPRYAGGRYRLGHTTMIVSRGLALLNARIPRIFNPPELVIVELV